MTNGAERITHTPGVCGGKACIAGHRIRVSDVVVWHEQMGMTPDQIVNEYPSITISDVYTALAWYFDHVDEIHEEMRSERARVEEFRRGHVSILESRLRDLALAQC